MRLKTKNFCSFNHQSAWSLEEICKEVEVNSSLKLESNSKNILLKKYDFIPSINDQWQNGVCTLNLKKLAKVSFFFQNRKLKILYIK